MGAALLSSLLLLSTLDDEPAFLRAQELYRSGDPVAAEVALGPLLDASQAAPERARLLVWAAMCADASGRLEVAQDRALAAASLDPSLLVPGEASVRLAALIIRTKEALAKEAAEDAAQTEPPATAEAPSTALPSSSATAPAAGNPRLGAGQTPDATEAAPPPPASTPPGATAGAPATETPPGGSRSHDAPVAAKEGEDPNKASAAAPDAAAEQAAAKEEVGDPEEEAALTITTSLWAVAGGALTIGLLVGAGSGVFGIYAGLLYYESLSALATDPMGLQNTATAQLQLAGILGAVAAVALGASAAAAGVAWWWDQQE